MLISKLRTIQSSNSIQFVVRAYVYVFVPLAKPFDLHAGNKVVTQKCERSVPVENVRVESFAQQKIHFNRKSTVSVIASNRRTTIRKKVRIRSVCRLRSAVFCCCKITKKTHHRIEFQFRRKYASNEWVKLVVQAKKYSSEKKTIYFPTHDIARTHCVNLIVLK